MNTTTTEKDVASFLASTAAAFPCGFLYAEVNSLTGFSEVQWRFTSYPAMNSFKAPTLEILRSMMSPEAVRAANEAQIAELEAKIATLRNS